MMYLDYPQLVEDIETKIMYEGIEMSKFCTENGISKSTFYRVKRHTPINMNTFLFFVNWLGKSADRYFTTDYMEYNEPEQKFRQSKSSKNVNPITGY